MNILITSGGTSVKIDDVRSITNMSSGRTGAAIALEALQKGHTVFFLHSKGSHTPFGISFDYKVDNIDTFNERMMILAYAYQGYQSQLYQSEYKTYHDYVMVLKRIISNYHIDVAIMCAAVSDYGVKPVEGKIHAEGKVMLELSPLDKVINKVKKLKPQIKVVGFKLLVGSTPFELRTAAMKVMTSSDADLVVGNDLNDIRQGHHQFTFFFKNGTMTTAKALLAEALIEEVKKL